MCASMGSAMFGYDSAFLGGTMGLPSFQSRFGLSDVSGTTLASLKANIVSTFQAGCFFGAIICHGATERLGRKCTLVACGIIFDVGVVFQLVSSGHIGFIYAGRAITGLAVGASSLLVPVYISECSPPAIRGRMVGIFEIFLQVFQVIGFWMNYAVNIHQSSTSNSQWLIPFGFQLLPGTVLALAMLTKPESPRWLIKAGKTSRARKILSKIRNLPQDHPYIQEEVQSVECQLENETRGTLGQTRGFIGLCRELAAPGVRNRLLLGMSFMMLQNLVGANAINYYSPSIFASIGLTGRSVGLLATGVYGIIKIVATSLFVRFIVDRFGRRVPLLIGSAVALTSMLYLGIYCAVSGTFSGGASQSAGGIAWIFCAEIFPLGWLGQFIVVYSTPYMMEKFKWGTFIFFAAFIVVGIIFAYFLVPETARLTLEDMDILFSTKGSARHKRRAVDAILQHRRQNDDLYDDLKVKDLAKLQLEPTSKHVEESRL
ncbi:Quinate permease [Fusarium oxysporum f. sp. cubense race 1]|uniref:Quinate transporter n=1 Tax=Fusarium oxysporum f. sp. cubense (strain race 1) TaxID=1229664 RepID=N4U9S7_FUSC1|nr:Quinate permease [Fusarium oxysporum f. sp. cubense race 1]